MVDGEVVVVVDGEEVGVMVVLWWMVRWLLWWMVRWLRYVMRWEHHQWFLAVCYFGRRTELHFSSLVTGKRNNISCEQSY